MAVDSRLDKTSNQPGKLRTFFNRRYLDIFSPCFSSGVHLQQAALKLLLLLNSKHSVIAQSSARFLGASPEASGLAADSACTADYAFSTTGPANNCRYSILIP